jgi:hypothetical protein
MRIADLPPEDNSERSAFAGAFSSGLFDPDKDTPVAISGPNGKAAVKRYNVYRNNVTVSLIDALAAIFPATRRITGEEFFRAMARFHIRATPPTSPLLFEYGRDFPEFIESYEFARPVPWLADVARLERAWLDAYHAADGETITPNTLASLLTEELTSAVFAPHPALKIVRSDFAIVSIFGAYRGEDEVSSLDALSPEDALISRPRLEVVVRRLPAGGACFIDHLAKGGTLGEAAAAATEEDSAFDLSANIAGMIRAGVFTATQYGDRQ